MKLSIKDIRKGYEIIKRKAYQEFEKGNIQGSLENIDHAVTLAQQFNWIYADAEIEDLIEAISQRIIVKNIDYKSNNNRVVFLDDYCRTFVLALQYLKALSNTGAEILYITGKDFSSATSLGYALEYIEKIPNITIEIIPQNDDSVIRIQQIFDKVISYGPSKCILHLTAKSIFIPVLYSLPVQIERYIINLADQTFWLGSKAIDYSLEFRQFGASVSLQRRGLKKEQLLLIPFYPIEDNNPFQGINTTIKNKIVIFSGGDFYKTIDKGYTYWELVKNIIEENSSVIFLYATKVDSHGSQQFIQDFIEKNKFEGRFVYIGFRQDINEVFKVCDIYMGTCPASGSLMSQLAAVNAKPILQFYDPNTPDDETESVICYNNNQQISFNNKRLFLDEAKRLISDGDYRTKRGIELQQCMITPTQFDQLVKKTLSENKTQIPITPYIINYKQLDDRWFAIEKKGYTDTKKFFISILTKETLYKKLPVVWIKYLIARYFTDKIINSAWYYHWFSKIFK